MAAVVVGVIWGLWHAPVIALFGLGAVVGLPGVGIKSWAIAPFFCLTTIPLGVIYAWFRFRSGTVWPCVLAHAMANSGLTTLGHRACAYQYRSRAPAAADLCPETGRAGSPIGGPRSSSSPPAEAGARATFAGLPGPTSAREYVSLPLLVAKSRYENLHSLQRYVRPSPEAVAALTAQHDPERRRRL